MGPLEKLNLLEKTTTGVHVRTPSVSVGRTSGSSPSRVHGPHRRPRLAAFEMNHVVRVACMKLRVLPDVLRCRPRERGALGESVTESAVFLRLLLFGGDFENW